MHWKPGTSSLASSSILSERLHLVEDAQPRRRAALQGGCFGSLARSVIDPAFTPGLAATTTVDEGLSRSFSNGFSHGCPSGWLKPVFEKPAKAGSGIHPFANPALKDRSNTLRARPLKRPPRRVRE